MSDRAEALNEAVSATSEVLQCRGLTKSFGDHKVVDDLGFSHRPGRDVRPARAERGGQDDHYLDDVWAAATATAARVT